MSTIISNEKLIHNKNLSKRKGILIFRLLTNALICSVTFKRLQKSQHEECQKELTMQEDSKVLEL